MLYFDIDVQMSEVKPACECSLNPNAHILKVLSLFEESKTEAFSVESSVVSV